MIKRFKNWRSKKRLFSNNREYERFLNTFDREPYLRNLRKLRDVMCTDDRSQVRTRKAYLRVAGFKVPTTEQECNTMIEDLSTWQPRI